MVLRAGFVGRFGTVGLKNRPTFDFTTGLFDARITYTGSNGTYFDVTGSAPVSATTNIARFNYNPSTHAPMGLMREGARTNLFLNADTLATQGVTVTAQPYTVSFYDTGTITFSGAYVGSVTGTGAYPTRTTVTFTPSAGTVTCTVTGSVKFANFEAGTFATSYIRTDGATVTRSADMISITDMSSIGYNSGQGTWYVEAQVIGRTTATNNTIIEAANAAETVYNPAILYTSGNSTRAVNNGPTYDLQFASIPTVGDIDKFAFTYNTNYAAFAKNGLTTGPDTSVTITAGVDRLLIGSTGSGSNSNNFYLRKLSYIPYQVDVTTLGAMTA